MRQCGFAFAAIVPALLASFVCGTSQAGSPALSPCDEAAAGSWVADRREQVLSYNELARYAVEHLGAPSECRGGVTSEFDGMQFGRLRYEFSDGAVLELKTSPPETSIVSLSMPQGFPDAAAARRLLRSYVERVGLEIDWSRPEIETEGSATVEVFWADESGLNAAARVVSEGPRITALRFSMAL